MQRALSGSALVHAAVLGAALIGFAWPAPEDAPAAESVSVSIVTMSSVSANATEVIQSDATADMVSSGAASTTPPVLDPVEAETVEPITETVEAVEPETQEPVTETSVEPLPPETAEPVIEATAEPLAAESAEPLEAAALEITEPQPEPVQPVQSTMEMAMLSSTAVSSLTSQPVAPAPSETIEPISSEDVKLAPVPQTLSRPRPSAPVVHKPQPPKPQPTQQATPRPATTPPPSTAGNGGRNNADSVASAGSAAPQVGSGNGGDAEVAKYPSEVLRKLRRALRSNSGPSGEVVVRFTVLANGQVTDISIGRSSGNSAVDQAGLATVSRAAPFPGIPPAANRASWVFDLPLAFGG
ncbi:protein TonB [Devosia sp. YR412]|uniref:energy transducer TonB family protein n=1 Tax=Devosia sp. YR412 TaxID=1881030 RepID=UPI0008BDC310|nr:energy transducer TonB [Devosia sp. YR412]SEQ37158.1 protein TonB [Devosia sp. YR412]